MQLCYVGKYLSDIAFSSQIFQYAIVKYKPSYVLPGVKVFVSNCGVFPGYVSAVLKEICNSELLILFRNPELISKLNISEEIRQHILYVNQSEYTWLESKMAFRLWASKFITTTPVNVLTKDECDISLLKSRFQGFESFVIQEERASGGNGTFLLSASNTVSVLPRLSSKNCYIVSPFIHSAQSGNAHVFISRDIVLCTPITKQLVKQYDEKLLYTGCVYNSNDQPEHVMKALQCIGHRLQTAGYRGYCGVDFLYDTDRFYLVEVNNRLQGSTALMDRVLQLNYNVNIYEITIKTILNQLSSLSSSLNIPIHSAKYVCTHITEPNHSEVQFEEANTIRGWSFQAAE